MKTFEEVADHFNYMRIRWIDEEELQCQVGYASEWAERFLVGREYECSDRKGQAILRRMEEK